MKRIILEGPDGSGKTTLREQLIEMFPQLIVMPSFKDSRGKLSYPEWLKKQMFMDKEIGILLYDRFYYSELVYGPILRGKVDIPQPLKVTTARVLEDTAFLIYCNLDYSELVKYVTTQPQMEGVLPNLGEIYRSFERIIGDVYARYWHSRRYLYYDWTKIPAGRVPDFTELREYIEHN
jgi:hypothetical protein